MDNNTIKIVTAGVFGTVGLVYGGVLVNRFIQRRRGIKALAKMMGVSYKEVNEKINAYEKNPTPENAIKLFLPDYAYAGMQA